MAKKTSKPKPKKKPTHEELVQSLLYIEELMERAAIPFVVMGEVSRQIYQENDPTLKAEKLEFGVMAKHMASSCVKALRGFLPDAVFANNKIYFLHENVPIHIHKLENDNKYANNPDSKFFFITQFRLPNPFNEFWEEYQDLTGGSK